MLVADHYAYRRYTAEAERLLKLAETPLVVTFPERATLAEIDDAKATLKAQLGRDDITMIPADSTINVDVIVAAAGVWATLALAAAQDRVIPTNRPINGKPETIRDGEGDTWHLKSNGLYAMSGNTKGETSLETIAAAYNGYTEVT